MRPAAILVVLIFLFGDVTGRKRLRSKVECPMPRICEWGCNPNKRTIDCSFSRLGPYAPDLPDVHTTEQWQADFSYNTILTLQNMAFYASYDEVVLFSLLDLSNNILRKIDAGAFKGLETTLHTLFLDNNKLESIPAGALHNLTKLHHLSVSGNKLTSIDFVCSASLPQLHKLDASYNEIREISPACFYGTRLGKTDNSALMIQGNEMKYLDACTLQGRMFEKLDYSNNSLVCMCEMSWLSAPDFNSTVPAECQLGNGELTSLNEYTDSHCEPLSINNVECIDFAINATYQLRFDNNSEVLVNWNSRDFPDIAHIHATIYLFFNGSSSKIGSHKIRRTETEQQYTIQLPENSGQDLLVCIDASNKIQTDIQPAPLTDRNTTQRTISENGTTTITDRAPVRHRQCQTVVVPGKPAELKLGQSLNGGLTQCSASTVIYIIYLLTFYTLL